MPETIAPPDLASHTRVELRQIASSLRQMRGRTPARPVYIRSGSEGSHDSHGAAVPEGMEIMEIAVSPEAMERIADLITQSGTDTPRRARTERNERSELTTQQAADFLGVSRPFLIKLLDAGKIPYRRVGRFRRLRQDDVERFEREEQARREAGLTELAALTQAIGLEY